LLVVEPMQLCSTFIYSVLVQPVVQSVWTRPEIKHCFLWASGWSNQ